MSKLELYDKLIAEMRETYIKKNKDYGDSVGKTYEEFGMVSFLVRMSDKLSRLTALTKNQGQLVKDERIEDTLLDLANYCLLAYIERSNDTPSELTYTGQITGGEIIGGTISWGDNITIPDNNGLKWPPEWRVTCDSQVSAPSIRLHTESDGQLSLELDEE